MEPKIGRSWSISITSNYEEKTSATAEVAEATDPVASQLGVARLRLGWTIEEASARTRLHLNVIRRLEAGDYDKFQVSPTPVDFFASTPVNSVSIRKNPSRVSASARSGRLHSGYSSRNA